MDYKLLFPGRFMAAVEFKGRDFTMKIKKVETEMLPQDKGGDKLKGIVEFHGAKKKLVLNRTNATTLAHLFGRNTDGWMGHWVTLYPAPYNDEVCIRIKGSPELEKPLVFELKLPRKSPRKVTLLATPKPKNYIAPPPRVVDTPEPEEAAAVEEMVVEDENEEQGAA